MEAIQVTIFSIILKLHFMLTLISWYLTILFLICLLRITSLHNSVIKNIQKAQSVLWGKNNTLEEIIIQKNVSHQGKYWLTPMQHPKDQLLQWNSHDRILNKGHRTFRISLTVDGSLLLQHSVVFNQRLVTASLYTVIKVLQKLGFYGLTNDPIFAQSEGTKLQSRASYIWVAVQ